MTNSQAIMFILVRAVQAGLVSFYGLQTGQPAVVSLICGLIMGNVKDALIIGASLQAMYMGIIAPGANIPTDVALATYFAVPMALSAGLSAQMAVVMAVPVGLFGVMVSYVRRTINAVWVHMGDRYAAQADIRNLWLCSNVYPRLFSVGINILLSIPIILATRYGPQAVDAFLTFVPEWVTHGLEVTGGMLPALGFAITIMVIGRRSLIPYFILGYYTVKFFGLGIIGMAVFGICFALLHIQFTSVTREEEL